MENREIYVPRSLRISDSDKRRLDEWARFSLIFALVGCSVGLGVLIYGLVIDNATVAALCVPPFGLTIAYIGVLPRFLTSRLDH